MVREHDQAVEYDPPDDARVSGNVLKDGERPDAESCDSEEEDSFDRMCK